MNDFSIKDVATNYINKHFRRSSAQEKERIINDWTNKIANSKSLVADFNKRIGNPASKKILDAGCGNGGISIAFALAGAEVHGVEIEAELYEISKKHAESYGVSPRFYLYDGLRLPFEDNSFDFAVSSSVLEHTDDPVLYLKEVLRVVKPGGYFYLGFPNRLAIRETHTRLFLLTYIPAFLRPAYIKLFDRSPLKDYHLHFYGFYDLQKIIGNINGQYTWSLIEEKGESQSKIKKTIKKILSFLGLNYKAFLPHILVILRKS